MPSETIIILELCCAAILSRIARSALRYSRNSRIFRTCYADTSNDTRAHTSTTRRPGHVITRHVTDYSCTVHNVGCPWQTARISGHGSQASSSSVPRLRERKEGSGVAISRPPTSRTMPLLPSAVGSKVSTLISSCMLSKDTENAAVSNGESSPPECE